CACQKMQRHCRVPGCDRCAPNETHYCDFCGDGDATHRSRNCPLRLKGNASPSAASAAASSPPAPAAPKPQNYSPPAMSSPASASPSPLPVAPVAVDPRSLAEVPLLDLVDAAKSIPLANMKRLAEQSISGIEDVFLKDSLTGIHDWTRVMFFV